MNANSTKPAITKSTPGVGQWDVPNSPLNGKNVNPFKKAEKRAIKLRMGLEGPSGSGKTMTALKMAGVLGGPIAVIDTEHGSSKRYADQFDFDSIDLTDFDPDNYVEMIKAAEAAGYSVIIIDSLSHAWSGKNGMLDLADQAAKRSRSGNSFQAWGEVKPKEVQLWEAILSSSCHVIATLRTKTEYVVEQNEKGKSAPRKLGMAPIQRADVEYEFDIVGDLNLENEITFSKTRCSALKGKLFTKPGENVMNVIIPWLGEPSDEGTDDIKNEATRPATALEKAGLVETSSQADADEQANDAADAPEESYPTDTAELMDRCLNGEEILADSKVKGFLNIAQKTKSRSAYVPKGILVEGTAEQLQSYLNYLQTIVDTLPED